MTLDTQLSEAKAPLLIWWIIWGAILAGLVLLYVFLGRGPVKPVAETGDLLFNLVGLVPLFVSIVIRWLVLPRFNDLKRAFPLFIAGLALAESCGILGIFLGGPFRDDLFVLGVLGVLQFVPLSMGRMVRAAGGDFRGND